MAIVGFTKLEALFRKAASLDIDKSDAKAITDIAEKKLLDLLIAGERNASLNGRDVIWEGDLPVTKGMQESIIFFKKLEEEVELQGVLNHLASVPPLKYPLDAELETKLPEIVGAILSVLARIMKEIDHEKRRVNKELIEKSARILDLTL